jgi:hypothetical protein
VSGNTVLLQDFEVVHIINPLSEANQNDILLSHVNFNKMSMVTSPSEQDKTFFFKPKNTKTETDPDRKPTFAQKTDPDPNRSQKVKTAGL